MNMLLLIHYSFCLSVNDKSPMESYEAAQAIFPTLSRALQKYLDDDMLLAKLLKLHSTEEGVDQLMQWEAGSQVSRLLADREAIREALDVVAGYSQNQETVTTGKLIYIHLILHIMF